MSPDEQLYCLVCGYDLHGLQDDVCPECGSAFDAEDIRSSQIPWLRRQVHGRWRCFWQTMWMVLFRRRAFVMELRRPVCLAPALAFRRMALWHVVGPLALVTGLGLIMNWVARRGAVTILEIVLAIVIPVVVLGALALFGVVATGTPGPLMLHERLPADQQDRVIALSYYTCGPLALTVPIGLVCFVLGLLGSQVFRNTYGSLLLAVAIAGPLVIPLAWFFGVVRLARDGLGGSELRLVGLGMSLIVCWCAEAVLLVVVLPLGTLYVLVAIASMLEI